MSRQSERDVHLTVAAWSDFTQLSDHTRIMMTNLDSWISSCRQGAPRWNSSRLKYPCRFAAIFQASSST